MAEPVIIPTQTEEGETRWETYGKQFGSKRAAEDYARKQSQPVVPPPVAPVAPPTTPTTPTPTSTTPSGAPAAPVAPSPLPTGAYLTPSGTVWVPGVGDTGVTLSGESPSGVVPTQVQLTEAQRLAGITVDPGLLGAARKAEEERKRQEWIKQQTKTVDPSLAFVTTAIPGQERQVDIARKAWEVYQRQAQEQIDKAKQDALADADRTYEDALAKAKAQGQKLSVTKDEFLKGVNEDLDAWEKAERVGLAGSFRAGGPVATLTPTESMYSASLLVDFTTENPDGTLGVDISGAVRSGRFTDDQLTTLLDSVGVKDAQAKVVAFQETGSYVNPDKTVRVTDALLAGVSPDYLITIGVDSDIIAKAQGDIQLGKTYNENLDLLKDGGFISGDQVDVSSALEAGVSPSVLLAVGVTQDIIDRGWTAIEQSKPLVAQAKALADLGELNPGLVAYKDGQPTVDLADAISRGITVTQLQDAGFEVTEADYGGVQTAPGTVTQYTVGDRTFSTLDEADAHRRTVVAGSLENQGVIPTDEVVAQVIALQDAGRIPYILGGKVYSSEGEVAAAQVRQGYEAVRRGIAQDTGITPDDLTLAAIVEMGEYHVRDGKLYAGEGPSAVGAVTTGWTLGGVTYDTREDAISADLVAKDIPSSSTLVAQIVALQDAGKDVVIVDGVAHDATTVPTPSVRGVGLTRGAFGIPVPAGLQAMAAGVAEARAEATQAQIDALRQDFGSRGIAYNESDLPELAGRGYYEEDGVAYTTGAYEKGLVTLDTGEKVRTAYYNSLSLTQQRRLSDIGIEAFEKGEQRKAGLIGTYYESQYVQDPKTGLYYSREGLTPTQVKTIEIGGIAALESLDRLRAEFQWGATEKQQKELDLYRVGLAETGEVDELGNPVYSSTYNLAALLKDQIASGKSTVQAYKAALDYGFPQEDIGRAMKEVTAPVYGPPYVPPTYGDYLEGRLPNPGVPEFTRAYLVSRGLDPGIVDRDLHKLSEGEQGAISDAVSEFKRVYGWGEYLKAAAKTTTAAAVGSITTVGAKKIYPEIGRVTAADIGIDIVNVGLVFGPAMVKGAVSAGLVSRPTTAGARLVAESLVTPRRLGPAIFEEGLVGRGGIVAVSGKGGLPLNIESGVLTAPYRFGVPPVSPEMWLPTQATGPLTLLTPTARLGPVGLLRTGGYTEVGLGGSQPAGWRGPSWMGLRGGPPSYRVPEAGVVEAGGRVAPWPKGGWGTAKIEIGKPTLVVEHPKVLLPSEWETLPGPELRPIVTTRGGFRFEYPFRMGKGGVLERLYAGTGQFVEGPKPGLVMASQWGGPPGSPAVIYRVPGVSLPTTQARFGVVERPGLSTFYVPIVPGVSPVGQVTTVPVLEREGVTTVPIVPVVPVIPTRGPIPRREGEGETGLPGFVPGLPGVVPSIAIPRIPPSGAPGRVVAGVPGPVGVPVRRPGGIPVTYPGIPGPASVPGPVVTPITVTPVIPSPTRVPTVVPTEAPTRTTTWPGVTTVVVPRVPGVTTVPTTTITGVSIPGGEPVPVFGKITAPTPFGYPYTWEAPEPLLSPYPYPFGYVEEGVWTPIRTGYTPIIPGLPKIPFGGLFRFPGFGGLGWGGLGFGKGTRGKKVGALWSKPGLIVVLPEPFSMKKRRIPISKPRKEVWGGKEPLAKTLR